MKTVVELLQEAKELIKDPKHWIRYDFAQDKSHESVGPEGPTAVCWCAMGALHRVTCLSGIKPSANITYHLAGNFLHQAVRRTGEKGIPSIIGWQDRETTSHEDVLRMFDRAIELARIEELKAPHQIMMKPLLPW